MVLLASRIEGDVLLLIECPWCGERDESEFSYAGEAHIVRPTDPEEKSDEEWADYLFCRRNSRGRHLEQWNHSSGCRRFFNVERDTVTNEIKSVYKSGEAPPGGGL
jgi:heterotetrameric sarcosine oxidase delta subunit